MKSINSVFSLFFKFEIYQFEISVDKIESKSYTKIICLSLYSNSLICKFFSKISLVAFKNFSSILFIFIYKKII